MVVGGMAEIGGWCKSGAEASVEAPDPVVGPGVEGGVVLLRKLPARLSAVG